MQPRLASIWSDSPIDMMLHTYALRTHEDIYERWSKWSEQRPPFFTNDRRHLGAGDLESLLSDMDEFN